MPRHPTPTAAAGTEVVLATFRANGLLLAAADDLGAPEGLTAARWQALGVLAVVERPVTVPQLARRIGLTRQSVHVTVDRLRADGLVELVPNADHQRSPLVRLTAAGQQRYASMARRQAAWVTRLVHGLSGADLRTTARVLADLCRRLADQQTSDY